MLNVFFSPMIRSTLATETGANNPGLRLYKYDTEAGEVNGQWPEAMSVVSYNYLANAADS